MTLPIDQKQRLKLEAECNRLKKLELKADQRLLGHKQRFLTADWHRKRCESGSERAAHWAAVARSAFNAWLHAANQRLAIASRRSLAEQTLALSEQTPAQRRARAVPHLRGPSRPVRSGNDPAHRLAAIRKD